MGEIHGVNKIKAKLAGGRTATYYYHRASGTKLPGEYGSPEFIAALAEAQKAPADRDSGTLAGLIRGFQRTPAWSKLADSTKKEYRRVFKFWEDKWGKVPLLALAAKGFRRDVLQWHADYSGTYPREADNRVTVLARVLSWAARDDDLRTNVLDTFERAYAGDRSEIIWEPGQIAAFMDKAICEMVADGEEGPDAYRHRYSDVTLTVDEVLEVASGVLAWCAEMDAAGAVSA